MLQEKKGSCFLKGLDDVPLVKGGLITYPAAQCIYGLFAYIYWHLRILTPSIQEPGLHNTALSPTMSAPMGAHNYTYRGYNCTYNSSYAFMFGHCPIYSIQNDRLRARPISYCMGWMLLLLFS